MAPDAAQGWLPNGGAARLTPAVDGMTGTSLTTNHLMTSTAIGTDSGAGLALDELSLDRRRLAAMAGEDAPVDDRVGDIVVEETLPVAEAVLPAVTRQSLGAGAILTDCIGLVVAAVGVALLQSVLTKKVHGVGGHVTLLADLGRLMLCLPVLATALSVSRVRWPIGATVGRHLHRVAPPMAAGGMICMLTWRLAQLAGVVHQVPFDAVVMLCVFGITTVSVARFVNHAPPRREGRRVHRVVIVGSGVVADRVSRQLTASDDAWVVGLVDDDPIDPTRCVGKLRELADVVSREGVDHVIVAFTSAPNEDVLEALRPLQGRVPITVVPRLFEMLPASATVHDLGSGLPAISIAPAVFGLWPAFAKRAVDIVGAGLGLVVLSPLLLATAIAVRMSSPGPVMFRQTRIGRDGREFAMVKFRSMHHQPSSTHPSMGDGEVVAGPFPKLKDDPRVTRVGRVIRRCSIDELPQLWNVLCGQMSLVGPRPFVPDDAAWIDGWAVSRYSVRPGITGLWQVSGRNDLTFDDMCRLDQLYVSSWSIGLDVQILFRTLGVVVRRHGAY